MNSKTKEEYYLANPLVRARRNYDMTGQRIFRLAIANLNPKLKNSEYYDEEFPTFHLSTKEVISKFQGKNGNDHRIYEKLSFAAQNMVESSIRIGDMDSFIAFPVFDMIKFNSKDGLTVVFNRHMKPLLLNLEKGNYSRFYLQLAFELSSKYSLILLELILQYRGFKKYDKEKHCEIIERTLTPEELRFSLDVDEKKYKLTHDFIKYVIDPAIREINEKTNYYINPDYKIERGRYRKIKAFVFTMILPDTDAEGKPKIKPKKEDIPAVDTPSVLDTTLSSEIPPAELPPSENNSIKIEEAEQREPDKPKKKLNDYTNEELKALKKLLEVKLNKDTALELVNECGVKAIEKAFKEMNQTKKMGKLIENPAGFIRYKTYEYFNSETEISEEDIFARVAEIEENERQELIRKNEEAERQKAEDDAKEAERKANKQSWKDWEVQALALSYIKNGNTFVDADKDAIEKRGWTTSELISNPNYMAYFYPKNNMLVELAKQKKAGDSV